MSMNDLYDGLMRIILPFRELEMKNLFIGDYGGMYSGSMSNMMSIIHKYPEGESITDVGGKTNPSALCLSGGRKSINIRVVDWFIESKTKGWGNIWDLTTQMLVGGNIANTTVGSTIQNIYNVHKT